MRDRPTKLKALIDAHDPDSIRSAVHLAVALDDQSVVDELLEGVELVRGTLRLGHAFAETRRPAHHHVQMATAALIATGIGTRARALRPKITRLDIAQTYRDAKGRSEMVDPRTPVDLSLLIGLPLRRLRVTGIPILDPERLRELPLESLSLDSIAPKHLEGLEVRSLSTGIEGDHVPTLAKCEELQLNSAGALCIDAQPALLTLTAWSSSAVRIRSAPQLYRAELSRVGELVTDEPLVALGHLHCHGPIRTPAHMVALRELRTHSQKGVADLPALRRLQLDDNAASVAQLRNMRLESFRGPDATLTTLEGYPRARGAPHRSFPELTSLHGIEAIEGIETLRVRAVQSLDGIQVLESLRGLDLRECRQRLDLEPVRELDLRAILLAGSAMRARDVPEKLRWCVVMEPNASVAALAFRDGPLPDSA